MKRSAPKRKTPLSPSGNLIKRAGKSKRFARRRDDTDGGYARFIRALPCLLEASGRCYGPVEADHVKTRATGGMDFGNLAPFCTLHHTQRHTMGRHSFQKKYNLDLEQIAKDLFSQFDRWGA